MTVFRLVKANKYRLIKENLTNYVSFLKDGKIFLRKIENGLADAQPTQLGDEFVALFDGKRLVLKGTKLIIS